MPAKGQKGRKPQIVTDTIGLLVGARSMSPMCKIVTVLVIETIHDLFPWLHHLFADGAYAGEKLKAALAPLGHWTIEIVERSDLAKGFMLAPRRWVVGRTLVSE